MRGRVREVDEQEILHLGIDVLEPRVEELKGFAAVLSAALDAADWRSSKEKTISELRSISEVPKGCASSNRSSEKSSTSSELSPAASKSGQANSLTLEEPAETGEATSALGTCKPSQAAETS